MLQAEEACASDVHESCIPDASGRFEQEVSIGLQPYPSSDRRLGRWGRAGLSAAGGGAAGSAKAVSQMLSSSGYPSPMPPSEKRVPVCMSHVACCMLQAGRLIPMRMIKALSAMY